MNGLRSRMDTNRISLLFLTLFVILLSACAPAATPPEQAVEETVVTTVEVPAEPVITEAPAAEIPSPLPLPTQIPSSPPPAVETEAPIATYPATQPLLPSPTAAIEERAVEVEWPPAMRLGESDVVRLALVPAAGGYFLTTEFPEHQTITQTIQLRRPGGYELFAVARLDGVSFNLAPQGDQVQYVPPDQPVSWRWSLTPLHPGRQRLSMVIRLRWVPIGDDSLPEREVTAFSRGLEVRVLSFLGLSQAQAMLAGLIGLLFGGSLGVYALVVARPKRLAHELQVQSPNQDLVIELPGKLILNSQEHLLLKALFQRYARLLIEQEFLSGYSGARAFLALPIRRDGRADAYTIAKLGERQSIRNEFENYETYVKDTLPPITARIQHPPVIIPGSQRGKVSPGEIPLAALQYTFIGEPGSSPTSLRQALLDNPDPALLYKLFDTFGANWWMQRRPHTFRLGQEYDRLLPTHFVIEPASGKGVLLDGRTPPSEVRLQVGDLVTIRNVSSAELRSDGRSLSLRGHTAPGHPPLRLRWLSLQPPESITGRIVATRDDLLRQYVAGCALFGLPDPFQRLPAWLAETLTGSQSTIHGDLNLENILVGPGNLVWLIDFAQTRDGHSLFDFAHLQAEIIAHVLAPQIASPEEYLTLIRTSPLTENLALIKLHGLFTAIFDIAGRCLFNPSQLREFHLALALACLGALKHANLDEYARQLLYVTAAQLGQDL